MRWNKHTSPYSPCKSQHKSLQKVHKATDRHSERWRKVNGLARDLRGLPRWLSDKEPACQCRRHRRRRFDPWVWKIPWRRARQPTPVFLSRESHGQRSLESYGLQGHKESTTTESNLAHTHNVFKIHLCCSLCPNCILF